MMKLFLKFLPFILIGSFLSAQVYIPYRIGDKFGISDENGKMIIPAQYDGIYIGDDNDFTAVSISGNTAKTSYILNNKVIIRNTDFDKFTKRRAFITGRQFYKNFDNRDLVNIQKLYDLKGNEIFKNNFYNIELVGKNERPLIEGELMLLSRTENEASFVLFNEKSEKIIKTFFENCTLIESNLGSSDTSLYLIYENSKKVRKKLELVFEDGVIKSEITKIISERNLVYDQYGGGNERMMMVPRKEEEPILEKPLNAIDIEKFVDIEEKFTRKLPAETLIFENKNATFGDLYFKKENNKIGYFFKYKNEYLIKPLYDDIFVVRGNKIENGYVVESNQKFQFLTIDKDKQNLETEKFDMFPLLVKRDYGKPGFYLLKLFDKDNKFFCYANQDGKLYYSK